MHTILETIHKWLTQKSPKSLLEQAELENTNLIRLGTVYEPHFDETYLYESPYVEDNFYIETLTEDQIMEILFENKEIGQSDPRRLPYDPKLGF